MSCDQSTKASCRFRSPILSRAPRISRYGWVSYTFAMVLAASTARRPPSPAKVQPHRNSDARRENDRMFTPNLVSFTVLGSTAGDLLSSTVDPVIVVAVAAFFLLLFVCWLCVRFVPNDCVAIVEKLWSPSGSVA